MQNPPPSYGSYGAPPPPPGDAKVIGLAPNVAAMLCYTPCCIIGLVISIIVIVTEKVNRLARFHAMQSLLLHAAGFAVGIVLGIIAAVLGAASDVMLLLFQIIQGVFGLGFLVVAIMCMVKANGGEFYKLPTIGDIAEKQTGGAQY